MSIVQGCDQYENENWSGAFEDQNLPDQPIKKVYSPCNCKLLCQEIFDCEYWTYDRSSKWCWLKKNFRYKTNENAVTSGWKGNLVLSSDVHEYVHNYYKISNEFFLNEDTLSYQHTCTIPDCGFGQIEVERTQGCNSDRYTCMKGFDVDACCGSRNAETRKCVPCDETALSRPDPSYEYTTLNECEYKKIPGITF